MAKTRFTTPRMRFVQGDVDEPQTTDAQGAPRVVKTGPNAGQPNPQYFIAGAIPKTSPEWPGFWSLLAQQAAADFPNLFPQGAAPIIAAGPAGPFPTGSLLHPNFSFKVIDGDGLDQNGKSNAEKPGFAGHWVVRFASSYPPKAFHVGHYAPHEQIQEKGAIKRGYFIRVNGSIDGNGNAQRPGLYLNLDLVELTETCPPDQLILSGPSAAEAFGGSAPATGGYAPPPAAPAAPPVAAGPSGIAAAIADGWQPHPSAPGYHYKGADVKLDAEVAAMYPAAPAAPPASPPPPAAPAAPPVQPYAGYMAPAATGNVALNAAAPAPPAAPPISAAGATPSLTSKAAGFTYEQLLAAGWNDETLRANGYIV